MLPIESIIDCVMDISLFTTVLAFINWRPHLYTTGLLNATILEFAIASGEPTLAACIPRIPKSELALGYESVNL